MKHKKLIFYYYSILLIYLLSSSNIIFLIKCSNAITSNLKIHKNNTQFISKNNKSKSINFASNIRKHRISSEHMAHKNLKRKKRKYKLKIVNTSNKNIINYSDLKNLRIDLEKNKQPKKHNNKLNKNSTINYFLKADKEMVRKYKHSGILDNFSDEEIHYFPYIIVKAQSHNSFPNEVLKNDDINKNIINFALGFVIGYGLNAEANEEIIKCFTGDSLRIKTVQYFFGESSRLTSEKLANNQQQESFISQLIGLFSSLKCNALKQTVFSFFKNKLISWGIKGLLYITTGPIGLMMKMGYDILKLGIEVDNYKKSLLEKPIDYTKLGTIVGRIVYYFQDLFFRKKKKY